jgi:small GTP-binding protein
MGKQEPPEKPVPNLKSSPDKTPDEGEPPGLTFSEIGGSPLPGLTLRHILRGHADLIGRFAWSPDGAYIASPSFDGTVRIWNPVSEECVQILKLEREGSTQSVAWSPDGKQIASSHGDNTVRSWEVYSGKQLTTFRGHSQVVWDVTWSPTQDRIASASADGKIAQWDSVSGKLLHLDGTESAQVLSVKWSPDGHTLASSLLDGTISLTDTATGKRLRKLGGHRNVVFNTCWLDNRHLVSASADYTLRLWDTRIGNALRVLEGHPNYVTCPSYSSNGRWLASRDAGQSNETDATIRIWNCETWECVAVLNELVSKNWFPGRAVAFHPRLPLLATLGEKDLIIRIWELDEELLAGQAQKNVQYTTAKIVLVGDSGVGKTGLGWRLAHDEFKEHSSTHGQQFWPISKLGLKREDGTECEAVLWDLAGQHVYRQIHSIFLENVAAALVLFDPSNRQEPLKGVQFWLEQLKEKGQLPPTVLVGARVDRGAPSLSQRELEQFCQRYSVSGGYISTSASSGEGLDNLLDQLKALIPWNEMTATVTTVTFKRIKDYVLTLKENPDRKGVLVSPEALREQLQAKDQEWEFSHDEMMRAVGHLETHGYIAVLRGTDSEQHILLTPELLVTLASSIVLLADKHDRELGAVNETELLQGNFSFAELNGLSPAESQILLDAAILRFLQHNICFRETVGKETLLVFPGLIKQKRPLQDDLPSADDISYVVRGRVENLYASLVVLLGYTPSFTRINQWQNQAQYEMQEGQICGFRLIEDREGEIELVLYYADQMPREGRKQFQELFEQFLHLRDVGVTRFPPVICPKGHRQERATVIKRVREGKRFVYCEECGEKTDLPNLDEPRTIGIVASPWLQREEASARLRSAYEVHLTTVKGYRRTWGVPRCYLSFMNQQAEWARQLIKDLRDAGVYVEEKAEQVQPDDYVVLLDTPAYQKGFKSGAAEIVADIPLVKARLNKVQVISLALAGKGTPHKFQECTPGNCCDETHYAVSLFDLVLTLYAIPLTHAAFAPLREALHTQWEQTLAPEKAVDASSALKVFISYAHKDEEFKNEFITMLAGLQQQQLITVWQDRQIEEGDEWYQAIRDAMTECDLAILFISPDFIASRFIQDKELPALLQRRQEEGLRVVPIIVRPCKWQSEPLLKDLQALPKDGKAVITFSKDNGERDAVWEQIATVIEKRARAR